MDSRINYLDGVRGFTMLLVVYSHLCVWSFNLKPFTASDINTFFITFRMPLFFFISGFFVYRVGYSYALLRKRLKNRLLRQLYPTVLIGALFCIVFEKADFEAMCFDFYKFGYWFTLVAVEMFVIAGSVLYLFNRLEITDRRRQLAAFILIAVASGALFHLEFVLDAVHSRPLMLINSYHLLKHLPFFIAGMVFRMYYDYALRLISSRWFLLGALACLVGVNLVSWPAENSVGGQLGHWLQSALGVLAVLSAICQLYRTRFSGSRAARALEFVGKSTLEIYLLHYFIVKTLSHAPFARAIYSLKGTWMELPVYLAMSVGVVCLCLLIVRLLKAARIYRFIFPVVKKPAQKLGEALS